MMRKITAAPKEQNRICVRSAIPCSALPAPPFSHTRNSAVTHSSRGWSFGKSAISGNRLIYGHCAGSNPESSLPQLYDRVIR